MGAGLVALGAAALVGAVVVPGPASAGTPVPPPTGALVVGVAGQYCPSPTYSTIQSAINAAAAGATIYVCSGTYSESLTIDKPLVLDGAQFDVDARGRDGSYETVLNGIGGITYGAGATSGTMNGFTVTGYTGAVAAVTATGTGSGWTFDNDIVDAGKGGIELNTDAVANPATSEVKQDVFVQGTPSAAPSGDEGEAVIIAGGTANNLHVSDDWFENLSGPGAAISTPGTAACGAALDSVNFSENLAVHHDTMTENGGSFTDPVNGPGYVDEPFLDLECTNLAQVGYDTVSITDAADPHARTAIEITGGDWSPVVVGNALDGNGTTSATGIAVSATSYPAGAGVQVHDNFVSKYATGISVAAGTGVSVAHNFLKSSSTDGILVSGGTGGTLTGNDATGSSSEDCVDRTTGSATAGTADTWLDDGGATSSPPGICASFILPAVTSASDVVADVGNPLSIGVTTTGYPAPSLSIARLPTGLVFTDHGNGTGTITGTPTLREAGLHRLHVKAVNSFRLTVNAVVQTLTLQLDRVPAFITPSNKTFVPGTSVRLLVRAPGYPFPALSESGPLPPGLQFTDLHNGSATITGTAAAPLATAKWPVTVSAVSAAGQASQLLTLTSTQRAATFSGPRRAAAVVGAPFSVTVGASSGYGPPALSESGTLPPGISFVDNHDGTATLHGTATSGTGAYHLLLSATTVAGSVSERFALLVDSTPAITSASNLVASTGLQLHFYVTSFGRPRPLVTESGALPPGVVFTSGTGVGKLSGVPTTTGTWTFSFRATNAVGSVSQTFTLVVV